jgi:hypothetical protein
MSPPTGLGRFAVRTGLPEPEVFEITMLDRRCQADALLQKLLELALNGDPTCLRMTLDRVFPLRKGRPVDVDMPPIKNSQDLFAAIAAIWTAIGEGRLTPDEASALSVVVDRSIQAIERHDVVTRITALEEAQEKREKRDKKAKNDDPVLSVLEEEESKV